MSHNKRNKQIASELRQLADLIEYDGNEIVAAISVYPKHERTQACIDQFVPGGKQVLYGGARWVESVCLDDKMRVRVFRGDV